MIKKKMTWQKPLCEAPKGKMGGPVTESKEREIQKLLDQHVADKLPVPEENQEHAHVDRNHLNQLIDQTEAWSIDLKKQLNDPKTLAIEELFTRKTDKDGKNSMHLKSEKVPLTILDSLNSTENEISGIYVLGDIRNHRVEPVYVGISRHVMRRLKYHGYGKSDSQSTLLKKMFGSIEGAEREEKLKLIRKMKVVVIPIESDYDLYIQEVMLAGLLQTEWNTFRTH
jgi:hypothetical protein